MADWYVSSVAYAAIAQWVASHAYNVGDIVRPLATPTYQNQMVYRCTTAGTSASTEPSWSASQNDGTTRADGTVTWTNVSGRGAHGWGAAAGNLWVIIGSSGSGSNRTAIGDRIFLSSDHTETNSTLNGSYQSNFGNSGFGLLQVISVNRAGAVPPVAADIQPGAALIMTNAGQYGMILDAGCNFWWQGISFSSHQHIAFNNNSAAPKQHYFKDCALKLNNTNSASRIGGANQTLVVLDNTTVQFGHTGQMFGSTNPSNAPNTWHLTWLNTPAALAGAIIPTQLFGTGGNTTQAMIATCRGVDLSAFVGSIYSAPGSSVGVFKILFESCKIGAAATRIGPSFSNPADEVELVNCFDGTNVINERWTPAGSIVTDRSNYMISGAQDDLGAYSLKMLSSSRADAYALPLDCFAFDVENTAIGASKTATVEIISSILLNNDEISLLLEYMGTSGNPFASFVSSLPAMLAVGSSLPLSSGTWNSPPATPKKQLLQVTFTPQRAGRVRGSVRLSRLLATVWVNPQITIV